MTPLEVQQKDLPDRPEKQSSVEASTKCNETPHTVDNIDSAELSQSDQNNEDVGEIEIPQDSLLNDIDLSTLNKKQKRAAVKMLIEEESSFAKRDSDIGCATDLQLEINLTDTQPVQKKDTSIPRPLFPEVKQYIEYLLNKQWILKSKSNYSSPVVAVRKRDGDLRLCVDFWELNNRSLPDRHPIPQVTDTLESLGGNDWFSLLDQGKAYRQGFVHPDSQYLTAFITPWGLYEWVHIPFGLMNGPAAFQRYMESCLGDLHDKIAIPYIDDIIVYSKTFSDHIDHIRQVLRCLRKHGIKLKAKNCKLFHCQVSYLGHIVSSSGYSPDLSNIAAVTELANETPTTVGHVRKLLGLVRQYCKFIQDFSKIAGPFFDLLKSDAITPTKVTKKHHKTIGQAPSSQPVSWEPVHQDASEKLLTHITNPPVLAYPDYSSPFVQHTDPSEVGLGAIIYQRQNGKMRDVGYGSRGLIPAEK